MDHVRHISFRADRHAGLLSYDPSLERAVLNPSSSWVEDDFEFFGRLFDLQLLYRHASPTAVERRRVARGFADAVQGHFDVYLQLMAGVKWERDAEGEWELMPCDCDFCRPVEKKPRSIGAHEPSQG